MQCEEKVLSPEGYILNRKTGCAVSGVNLQYQQCDICSTNRESVQYQEGHI